MKCSWNCRRSVWSKLAVCCPTTRTLGCVAMPSVKPLPRSREAEELLVSVLGSFCNNLPKRLGSSSGGIEGSAFRIELLDLDPSVDKQAPSGAVLEVYEPVS